MRYEIIKIPFLVRWFADDMTMRYAIRSTISSWRKEFKTLPEAMHYMDMITYGSDRKRYFT